MHITVLNHDAFARQEFVRRPAPFHLHCAECGQPAKFEYGYSNDGAPAASRIAWHPKAFCCVGCYRAYV
jgi:hypothetical protein